MRKEVTVAKVNRNDSYNYVVKYPNEGKLAKKYFKTKVSADDWANHKDDELNQMGREQAHVSHANRLAIDLWERAREEDESLQSLMLQDIVSQYLETHKRREVSITLSDGIKMELGRLERLNKSKRHYQTVKSNLGMLERFYEGWYVSDLTTHQLESYLFEENSHWSQTTRANHYRSLSALFNLMVKEKAIGVNPVTAIEITRDVQEEPETYTPEELSKLLVNCPERSVSAMALCAFCGIRRSEIEALEWRAIRNEKITVSAKIAKASKRRTIDIPENCMAWIQPYMNQTDSITPTETQYRKDFEKAHEESGVKKAYNGLRHSFASYHVALNESADKTALILGHSNATVLFNHYQAIVSKEDAEAYFSLIPNNEKNLTQFKQA